MSWSQGMRSGARRRAAAAAVVAALALAGCGSSDSGGSADTTTTTVAKSDPTTTAPATTTTDAVTTTGGSTTTTEPTPGSTSPILKETEIGPLRLGMTLADAQATGWVGADIGSCAAGPDGTPPAGTGGYGLDGSSAPEGLDGSISVVDDKIATINIRGGARMANDVMIEPFGSWTPDLAMKALNQAGYTIAYDTIFETNDLAKVTSPDGNHYELSLTPAGVSVAVPHIEVCD